MKVIPRPQICIKNKGVFCLEQGTFLHADETLFDVGKLFNELVEKSLGFSLCEGTGGITFVLEPSFEPERYKINISSEYLTVHCGSPSGGFNAVQTLRQIMDLDLSHNRFCNVNCGIIDDAPRYAYRGVSLDIVRHFFGVEHVLKFIDQIARLKFNYLHLHLSDDQGYRIESTIYPRLNTVSSYREKTSVRSKEVKGGYENIRYGGYLTKQEVKHIVAYAASRGITVIPELDLPGHMVAVISAYPFLSCRGKDIPVRCEWGISKDILCAGNDEVYAFLCNLLDELCELFPAPYFHIGGDEAPKNRWRSCPKCRKKMRENGIKSYTALQGYMVDYFADYLRKKGKTAIVWNEALCEKLPDDVIVQHWTAPILHSNKPTVEHINKGRKTIMSYFTATYLDYPYAMTPLRTVYEFNPVLHGVKITENIWGTECNIWCEHIRDEEKFDFNVFPRIVAHAENAWTEKKDHEDFCQRLQEYYKVLDICGVKYAKDMEYKGKNFNVMRKFFTQDAYVELNNKKE